MPVIGTERGLGEYSLFQVIADKNAEALVEIAGLEGPGVRFAFYFLYGLTYLAFPQGGIETSSSHPGTLLKEGPDRSTLPSRIASIRLGCLQIASNLRLKAAFYLGVSVDLPPKSLNFHFA